MQIAPEEANGTISFGSDVVDMSCPTQVATDGYAQVFTVFGYFQYLIME